MKRTPLKPNAKEVLKEAAARKGWTADDVTNAVTAELGIDPEKYPDTRVPHYFYKIDTSGGADSSKLLPILKVLELKWDDVFLTQTGHEAHAESEQFIATAQQDNPVMGLPHTSRLFASYIDLKLRDFAGRDHVFDAFNAFMGEHDRGYFNLVADPGEGKSAIAAHYVRNHPCFFYFNRRGKGLVSPEQFLDCLCKQLTDVANITLSWPPDATENGFFLVELLKVYSEKRQKVVVVVDALDEADKKAETTLKVMPDEDLPKGVYFFVTLRRDDAILSGLPRNVPRMKYDLANYAGNCEDDLRKYWDTYINDPISGTERRKQIMRQPKPLDEFKEELIRKSKRNFMFMTLVLPEIVKGRYQGLEINVLPDGLAGYYEEHWKYMRGVMEEMGLPLNTLRIVYHICANKMAMSVKTIAKRSGKEEIYVRWVLEQWMQFLDPEEFENRLYAFYHESYKDHLKRKPIIESAGNIDLREINREITRSMMRGYRFG